MLFFSEANGTFTIAKQKNMITLDKALDEIMKMDYASKEMLSEILSKRVIEERRKTYASHAKKAKTAFVNGKIKAQSAKQVIDQLNTI